MTDYTAEIASLKAAIASGTTLVRHGDLIVHYETFDKLLARLNWLNAQNGAKRPAAVILAGFGRGDNNSNSRGGRRGC